MAVRHDTGMTTIATIRRNALRSLIPPPRLDPRRR
jgi:hypothetical protein